MRNFNVIWFWVCALNLKFICVLIEFIEVSFSSNSFEFLLNSTSSQQWILFCSLKIHHQKMIIGNCSKAKSDHQPKKAFLSPFGNICVATTYFNVCPNRLGRMRLKSNQRIQIFDLYTNQRKFSIKMFITSHQFC